MIDLLVIAPSSKKLYQDLSKDFSAIETPIWAGLLSNSVRSMGKSVEIYDLDVENPSKKEFIGYIQDRDPKLILFVSTGANPNSSSSAMAGTVEASQTIKENLDYTICVVGPHVAALPVETLEKHDCIDICLTNEGVYALRNLVSGALSDLASVKGLAYRDNDGYIHLNEAEKIVPQDMLEHHLPGVAYDLMPHLSKYRTSSWHSNYIDKDRSPFASIYTSLGCPFVCDFCMINQINRTDNNPNHAAANFNVFRYWNPEFIIKQFDYLAEQGVTQVKIADEMFVLKPKHFIALCDLLIDRDYKMNIWSYSRIDSIKEKYLEKLKKAGINWIALGIESGSQEIRQEITKGKFVELNIREVCSMVNNAGINVVANYIVGLGHDTWDTMQQTLNLALEINAENSNIYCATALPGSPLYLQAIKEGRKLPTNYSEFGFLSYDHVPDRTPSLKAEEVLAFRDYAFNTLFTNPRFLNKIENKFGIDAVDNIKKMTDIKLKRKICQS